MLKQFAFANSLAILTGGLYVLFDVLALVSPHAFQLLFNAQFFGADVAALLPKVTPSIVSLVTFVIVVGMSWVKDMCGPGCTIASRRRPDRWAKRTRA